MTTTLLTREEIEQREADTLAPYAALAAGSKGRTYPQKNHPLRTVFQRDRDRIVHSTAFRRLEYKTQVFIPHERDHYRTRLTHTIEVAQVARTLARNLRLNEDLTEAIALVHDLGHTPFGHAGEDVLNELLADEGGFNHNRQSLRIVDLLEQRYPEHPGLNLSYEVREGIVKHETSVKIVLPEFESGRQPTLEASLVDAADEIAYNAHDIDDGLSSGLISYDAMKKRLFWRRLGIADDALFVGLNDDQQRYALVRRLIDGVATDLIEETRGRIDRLGVGSLDDVRRCPEKIVGYSTDIRETVLDLKDYLFENLYRHPRLQGLLDRAREILKVIYSRLSSDPAKLPERFREMLLTESPDIVIADYIAGMTDRYAEKVYEELTGQPAALIPPISN